MLNPQQEEALLQFREMLPRMWWNIYQGCIASGFDKYQAYTLTQTYVLGQAAGKVIPGDGIGPGSDDPEK